MTEQRTQYVTHKLDYGDTDDSGFQVPVSGDLWSVDWLVALKAAGIVITWTLCLSFAIAALFMFFNGSVSMALFLALFSLLFKGGVR